MQEVAMKLIESSLNLLNSKDFEILGLNNPQNKRTSQFFICSFEKIVYRRLIINKIRLSSFD